MISNNAPDIELPLTHEQATFLLKNCIANHKFCLAMIMSLADEDIDIELKRAKAEPIAAMQDKFTDMMKLLRKCGAKEPDDDE